MKRDALVAVVVALLALVALGVAAATLDTAVDTGSGGFGGSGGDAPSVGSDAGDPGVLTSSGEGGEFSASGLCFPALREPPAVIALLVGVTLLAGITYRDTASPLASVAVAGVMGAPIGVLFWVLSTCRSVAENVSIGLGLGGNGTGLLPAGAAGGGGFGSGEGAASAPQILFAVVVVVAVIASVAALLLAGGDDEADGDAGGRTDEPADEPPDLAAVGRTAGEAADRIESSDADNEVYRAWRDMTDVLDVDRPASSTPAEFATAAVDAGVDEEPVTALTEVFERVRYGGEDATDDRERRAVEALRRIEERHGGDS
ncbi:hypothetical protein C463_10425 [Halorubrum californiense DSM 19288]|uniref:Protein-glutamine gamma-glutamyltransferase-like C-terminal domain-containing protein n=1 Tax=Halorubrum californiense DSM 19288 TaxID=1227465 RepID=M0E5H2_9EURY|nr:MULTISPECIES: DUF4129 domain-containing protein [Halorubrum]ELZ43011.1 hypothetical protein C463_10425 [Halorubrum californiense DSM 19288]TKX66952.1 DUF4129 domain-containing protein [Halorubrum sp. GN11GM_10-3_MGM]